MQERFAEALARAAPMSVTISPIVERDLGAVGRFLNENLNGNISATDWIESLKHPWCAARPNFGFKAHDGERLVGVFCAIYSDQLIEGSVERFCNPHSWCVLEEYRGKSVALPLHLTRQNGYHFTMLTPNPKVAEIFLHLGFKKLDDTLVFFPNLPSLRAVVGGGGQFVCSDLDRIARYLTGSLRSDFDAHRALPWLRFVAFGKGDDVCLVVYKRRRWKKLSCASIVDISDPATFDRYGYLMGHHLLLRQGLVVSRVERRFLVRMPRFAHSEARGQPKLFLSPTLRETQVRDLYTELVALDL